MSEPNDKTKVAWLELEGRKLRGRIADLERQLAELTQENEAICAQNERFAEQLDELLRAQPTAQQVKDVASLLAAALKVLVENGGIGPEDMFDDARDALAKYAALQAGKEKEHGN